MIDLARSITPTATWSDLVLPDELTASLLEIVAQVRNRTTVHQEWGFGARYQTGLGIGALFCGRQRNRQDPGRGGVGQTTLGWNSTASI